MWPQRYIPLGFQAITSLSTAQSLTVPAGATHALVHTETNAVRWRDDGTAPTSSVGMYLNTTDQPLLYSGNLNAIQFIAATGTPTIGVSYYRLAG